MIDYRKYFPYKRIRPEQDRVLKKIVQNWDKKYFILQLDVGIGKSGIGKCAANWCNEAFIVTQTKQLQDQYMADFAHENNMKLIKGRGNYRCLKNPNCTCDNGPCSIKKNQDCIGVCPYNKARDEAVNSKIVLTNYSYIFGAFEYTEVWQKRDLLVFDECHLLEQQLVSFAQFYLSPNELEDKYGLFDSLSNEEFVAAMKPFTQENFTPDNERRFHQIHSLIKQKCEYFENIFEKESKNTSNGMDIEYLEQAHKEYINLMQLNERMDCFKNTFKGSISEWLIKPAVDGDLVFTPLKVDSLFVHLCNNWADKFIMMSATILDIEGFIKELGIDRNEVVVINEESTFDPANSPIYYMPCGSMNYQNIDQSLIQVESVVEKILNYKPTEKGIIHTGNYKVANFLNQKIGSSRFIIKGDDKKSNQKLIEEHIKSPNPTVLVSPSMTTGVDLKDDLSRWQVIVKMPFGSLTDERIKKKAEIDPDWYACEALKTLIQACGRSTRSQTDHSVTYVLDSSFKYWVTKYRKWLSSYFLNRIKGF